MEVFPGISMDPDVRFGKPCLSGTRIDVATIVGAVAAGCSIRVNDQYRVTFRWESGNAFEVRVEDYH